MAEAHRDRATEQRAEIDGANNIVVQIEGDRNTVNLKGFAHLTLTRYLTRRRIDSDADLLSPYTRSIPLIGRDAIARTYAVAATVSLAEGVGNLRLAWHLVDRGRVAR